MVEISLSRYLEKIDDLIEERELDEAIAHSRHILEHHPKNGAVYRALGRVLMLQSRWDEAAEVYRRLLGAYPTDFNAHYQLSSAYERLERHEAAIWHLERAYDQQPNNKNVITRLRKLYADVRGVQLEKLQLTAGAIAEQYLRNGLSDEAVRILADAVERMPSRLDLRLQLARALWQSELRVEAAENAIDVLQDQPFTIEANRILTELWLQEQRPSDAQRYLSRIEDVDPYLAMQLASNDTVPADTFTLEELNYDRFASHELSQQNPDWLEGINEDSLGDEAEALLQQDSLDDDDALDLSDLLGDGLDADGVDASDFEQALVAEGDAADLDDDSWLDEFADDGEPEQPIRKKVTDNLPGLLPDDYDETAQTPDAETDPDGTFTGGLPAELLDNLDVMRDNAEQDTIFANPSTADADSDDDDDVSDLLDEIESTRQPQTGQIGERTGFTGLLNLDLLQEQSDDPDDASWLQDLESGQYDQVPGYTGYTGELNLDLLQDDADDVDDGELADLLGDIDESRQPQQGQPSQQGQTGYTGELNLDLLQDEDADAADEIDAADAWLTDLDSVPSPTTEASAADASDKDAEPDDEANPLAWAQQSGVEFLETSEVVNPYYEALSAEDDDDFRPEEQAAADPLAWAQRSGIELIEDEQPAKQALDADDVTDAGGHEEQDREEVTDPFAWTRQSGVQLIGQAEEQANESAGATGANETDDQAWLADESALEELFELEGLTDDSNTAPPAPASTVPTNSDEWQDTMPDRPSDWQNDPSADSEFDDDMNWLDDMSDESDDANKQPEGNVADESTEFDWLAEPQDSATADAEEPAEDWLLHFEADDTDTATDDTQTGAEAEADVDWLDELGADDEAVGDAAVATSGSDDAGADADDDLSDLFGDDFQLDGADADVGVNAEAGVLDELDWLAEPESSSPLDASETPQAEPEEPADAPDPVRGPDAGILARMGQRFEDNDDPDDSANAAADANAEPDADGDWLAAFAATNADITDEPDWLADIGAEPDDAPSPIEADQVSAQAAGDAAPGQDDLEMNTPDWLADLEADEQAATPISDESTPEFDADAEAEQADLDWLADLGMTVDTEDADAETATAQEPVAEDDFSDLDFDLSADETELGVAAAEFDSLDFDFSDEASETPEPEAENAPEFAVTGDSFEDFGFLDELESVDAEDAPEAAEAEPEPIAAADPLPDELAIGPEFIEEETEPEPVENAPEWLNAMVPGLDIDYAAAEDEQIEQTFAQRGTHRERSGSNVAEFAWLNHIVEEETASSTRRPVPDLPPMMPTPQPSSEKARYAFTQPPVWMRNGNSVATNSDELPDYLRGDDDTDTDFFDFDYEH